MDDYWDYWEIIGVVVWGVDEGGCWMGGGVGRSCKRACAVLSDRATDPSYQLTDTIYY